MKIPIGKLKLRLTSGIILLALALHFFIAISLPFIQVFDMVATSFDSTNTKQDVAIGSFPKLTQIRVSLAKL